MTNAAAQPATIAANLRWFALAYTAATIVFAAAVAGLGELDIEFAFETMIILNVIVFSGVASAAGYRFEARRPNWDERTRHSLALGYVLVSWLASLILMSALCAAFPVLGHETFDAVRQFPLVFVVVSLATTLVFYVAARVSLRSIVTRKLSQSTRLEQ